MNQDVMMFIAMVTGIVLVAGQVARVMRARHIHITLREALRSQSDTVTSILDKLDDRKTDRGDDDRLGLVLLSLGAAFIGYAFVAADGQQAREIVGLALFPIFVGGPLLVRALYVNARSKRPV